MNKETQGFPESIHPNHFTDKDGDIYEQGKDILSKNSLIGEHTQKHKLDLRGDKVGDEVGKQEKPKMANTRFFSPDNDKEITSRITEQIKKLEALTITGDPIRDLQAYIEISGLRTNGLSKVQTDLGSGERIVALDYLRTLKESKDDRVNMPGLPEIYRKNMEVEGRIIGEIIRKAEENKENDKGNKEIEKI